VTGREHGQEAERAQREYNLCPGCGKTSTPYRGGWKHGGIEWHDGCLGKPSLFKDRPEREEAPGA
jgi:hypothetical protein